MTRLSTFLKAGLLASAATAEGSPAKGTINWGPCTDFNSTEPIQCANLTVPLDYTDQTSNKTLELQLLRIPALRQPSKGSILFNFGGPSVAGRPTMAQSGVVFRNATSEYHDLVTFDPRGTGNTIPFKCFDSEEERAAFLLRSPRAWSFMKSPNYWANSSDITPGRAWASAKLLVDKCYERNKDIGNLVGSAFVARDMIQIVDALGEDGLLRYWGGSYGTLLGQTAAALFPERIDRMVLDGNLNPHDYYHGHDDEQWTDSDKVFSAIFKSCTANPSACPLARWNMTAAQLEEAAYTLIDDLNDRPIPFNGTLIDYNVVKTGIMTSLYSPAYWPVVHVGLDALMSGNLTLFTRAWDLLSASYDAIGADVDSQMGIRCSDKFARVETLDEFMPIMERQVAGSRIFGDVQIATEMLCAQWRFAAKGQYTGDFRVKTRHPLLFIGNTADAFTPLVSARNASAGFEGSVVIHTNGYGHGSAGTTKCAGQATTAYYLNGTLPLNGTFCELDKPILLEPAA